MLRSPGAPPSAPDTQIAELLGLADKLRDLPRAEFKLSLRNELEQSTSSSAMPDEIEGSEESHSDMRERFRTVTPYLTVPDVHEEIDFITKAFGAEGRVYGLGSAGGFHSEYRIGDSMLMIGGGGKGSNWTGSPAPASLHLYVENVDDVYQRAVSAGATVLMPPTDHEYGERSAALQDIAGNHWYVATSTGPNYVPEGVHNLMPFFHPRGAPKMIEFMKQAFGAEEISVYQSPDGIVHHATIRIGDSVVEMGEAHGQWQPRPMVFMVYVEDCDAWYARAMKAEGALSVSVPADEPYGDRVAAVKDPFDNLWYIGTHLAPKEAESAGRRITMVPKLFRVALQVSDLDQAVTFYSQLLDDKGISIPRGSRHYFDCGPVILALVDVAKGAGEAPQPTPDYIYFAVNNLEEVYQRAKELGCLAKDRYHDQSAGEIVKRPWGELSFYVEDPWGNGLCFVDEKTLFTGK